MLVDKLLAMFRVGEERVDYVTDRLGHDRRYSVNIDKITNLAGEDREALKNEPLLHRFEVLDQDGETDDGKPFFRIPGGSGPDLVPYSESRPATVRLRNKDYLAVFTPSFRILGLKRQPPKPKAPEPPRQIADNKSAINKLIQTLIKKGLITEEEAKAVLQP